MTLAEYLKLTDTTVEDFATKIKVSRMSVHRWMAGTMPRHKALQRIMQATGGRVTADSFLSGRRAA